MAYDGHPGTLVRGLGPLELWLGRVGKKCLDGPSIKSFGVLSIWREYRGHLCVGSLVQVERGAGGSHLLEIKA